MRNACRLADSLSAGFRVHRVVVERGNSGQKLLDVGEKGVGSSYALLRGSVQAAIISSNLKDFLSMVFFMEWE